MTDSREHASDARRPTRVEAAASPTACCNLIASLLLLAGFFLPHSADCDDRTHRPITIAQNVVAQSSEPRAYLALTILWPFAFAGLTATIIIVLVLARPAWVEHGLLAIPLLCAAMLTVLWTLLLFGETGGSRAAMVIATTTLPPGACIAARMVWLYRSGRIAAAAAWGQSMFCVMAAFSLRWFWFPPVERLLWGGMLSIASTLLMMISSWSWITRARHDLFDRSVKPLPFQVSLRQVFLGITLTAVALTYWRFLGSR